MGKQVILRTEIAAALAPFHDCGKTGILPQ
jgi:hypothetical protein